MAEGVGNSSLAPLGHPPLSETVPQSCWFASQFVQYLVCLLLCEGGGALLWGLLRKEKCVGVGVNPGPMELAMTIPEPLTDSRSTPFAPAGTWSYLWCPGLTCWQQGSVRAPILSEGRGKGKA